METSEKVPTGREPAAYLFHENNYKDTYLPKKKKKTTKKPIIGKILCTTPIRVIYMHKIEYLGIKRDIVFLSKWINLKKQRLRRYPT